MEKYAVFVEKKQKKAGSMPPCAAFLHSVQKCEIEGRGWKKKEGKRGWRQERKKIPKIKDRHK